MSQNACFTLYVNPKRELFKRDPMIYGHFLEHFHRQIYDGVYDPGSPLADEDGFRTDVIEALKEIQTPIIRWPGGCFVSAYHWKKGVGEMRVPSFDKAWRVEDPNTFGTDEFIKLCRKIGCEPYICTNAGSGNEEEMSDWVEYCNLKYQGEYAKWRIANGNPDPFNVKYWSIGNENYGSWEIGAKDTQTWARLVCESAKMIKHVDPSTSLSAAALGNIDWDLALLKAARENLEWVSVHQYWDFHNGTNTLAGYEKCMYYTKTVGDQIRRTRGLLNALDLDKKVRIAFDEWNLRGWYHPFITDISHEENAALRDKNDSNSLYTMADAVFSACFLNECLRNADIVGMANFSPVVNTRGAIFTYEEGIVKRTTYHVFALYTKYMGDTVLDSYADGVELYAIDSEDVQGEVDCIDSVATLDSASGRLAVSLVNKHMTDEKVVKLAVGAHTKVRVLTLSGESADDYNDIGKENVVPYENAEAIQADENGELTAALPAHSINIVLVDPE